ncbi:MAG: hypothetical protein FD143_2917 [Ignavibacteria bacterium]|nr:MAG: hypothetical protein FD143_2917 [Ignavibacteria bacterium]
MLRTKFLFLVGAFLAFFIERETVGFVMDDFSKGFVFMRVVVLAVMVIVFGRDLVRMMTVGIFFSFMGSSFVWFLIVFEFLLLPISLII